MHTGIPGWSAARGAVNSVRRGRGTTVASGCAFGGKGLLTKAEGSPGSVKRTRSARLMALAFWLYRTAELERERQRCI